MQADLTRHAFTRAASSFSTIVPSYAFNTVPLCQLLPAARHTRLIHSVFVTRTARDARRNNHFLPNTLPPSIFAPHHTYHSTRHGTVVPFYWTISQPLLSPACTSCSAILNTTHLLASAHTEQPLTRCAPQLARLHRRQKLNISRWRSLPSCALVPTVSLHSLPVNNAATRPHLVPAASARLFPVLPRRSMLDRYFLALSPGTTPHGIFVHHSPLYLARRYNVNSVVRRPLCCLRRAYAPWRRFPAFRLCGRR